MRLRRIDRRTPAFILLFIILAALGSFAAGSAQESNEPSEDQPVVWNRYEFSLPDGDNIGLMRAQVAAGFEEVRFEHDGPYLMLIEEGPICLTVESLMPGTSIDVIPANPPQSPVPECDGATACDSDSCTIDTEGAVIYLNPGDSVNVNGGSLVSITNLDQTNPATLLISDNHVEAAEEESSGGSAGATPVTVGCKGGCWHW